jgi:TetR/AcrR family transcriptional repressor of nem operon
MRVTKQQALENRTKILTEAARLVRERGLSGIGVDALTEAAGLTHGSLYSHFSSKDHLMAEALDHGFTQSGSQADGVGNVGDVISAYLSAAHRDNPGRGCFMATLGCEMPRQTKTVRRTFTKGVRGNIARLAALLPSRRGQNGKTSR